MKLLNLSIALAMTALLLAVKCGPALGLPPTKPSENFDYKYEMDLDLLDPSAIDLDSNSMADWANSGAVQAAVSGGVLSLPNDSLVLSGFGEPSHIWPSVGMTAEEGFTFEISLKVVQQYSIGNYAAMGINFGLSDSDEYVTLVFRDNGFNWSGVVATTIDNTDAFHTYRFSRDADVDGGGWWAWCDDELFIEGTRVVGNYVTDAVRIGPAISGGFAGDIEIDYIRFTEGAFAPGEESEEPIPGDANNDGKVDGSDVTILAGNWQAGVGDPNPETITWEMGDFNGDGQVDGSDVTILAGNWQAGVTAAAASVPEPSTILLILSTIAGVALIRR